MPLTGCQGGGDGVRSVFRKLRVGWLVAVRRMSLSQRFLVLAVLIVTGASTGLGVLGGHYVQRSITEGVVTTAASSIQALVAHHLSGLRTDAPLSAEDRARLDHVFAIGNDSESTRLLEIHILNMQGDLIYRSLGELAGIEGAAGGFEAARQGEVLSRISTFEMAPVGRIGEFPIELLEIYTPLRRAETGEIFAVAELFYSARSVTAQRSKAQQDIWILVSLSGLLVIAALYFVVDRASRTIVRQRLRLAANLAESRRLSIQRAVCRQLKPIAAACQGHCPVERAVNAASRSKMLTNP